VIVITKSDIFIYATIKDAETVQSNTESTVWRQNCTVP